MTDQKLPPWAVDLVNCVGTDQIKQIVADLRSYNPSPGMGKAATVVPADAGKVVTGTDGAKHLPRRGWQESPRVDSWRPPGEAAMNRIMDAEDAKWRAERIKEMAETARHLQALAEAEAEVKKQEPPK
jgi:hypothetical protein